MTLNELKAKNPDILLKELDWNDVPRLAAGAALFYVSLSGKAGAKDNKTILCASHVLTTGMFNANQQLGFIRITQRGNTKTYSVSAEDLQPDGRAALFQTVPLTENDPRCSKPWNQWA